MWSDVGRDRARHAQRWARCAGSAGRRARRARRPARRRAGVRVAGSLMCESGGAGGAGVSALFADVEHRGWTGVAADMRMVFGCGPPSPTSAGRTARGFPWKRAPQNYVAPRGERLAGSEHVECTRAARRARNRAARKPGFRARIRARTRDERRSWPMTAEEWVRTFAEAAGAEPPEQEQMDEILRLAAVAAHASERIAAPIACWVAGTTGRPLSELRELAEGCWRAATRLAMPTRRSMPERSIVILQAVRELDLGLPSSSTSRASVMSGWRTLGSSCGQRLEHDLRARAGDLDHRLGQLQQRHLVRVAEVHRVVVLGAHQRVQARGPGRPRNRSCGSGSRRRTRSAACPAAPGAGRSGPRARRGGACAARRC